MVKINHDGQKLLEIKYIITSLLKEMFYHYFGQHAQGHIVLWFMYIQTHCAMVYVYIYIYIFFIFFARILIVFIVFLIVGIFATVSHMVYVYTDTLCYGLCTGMHCAMVHGQGHIVL